ncbi:uncharacterized protein L3040_005736 [Drepanopeziza brunnea f. sp. 'multigermtubi']|uniref:Pentatricopeptide repeat protein n=1 Tax=Marssonina brunnea f. sp. multigermtubi (strain MB_m1) TaxID=1072389 RepID=K1WNC0_MARBU|nr:pentatricopeptide repeat protein [Drepanopeziza brunnea f. sp. 'multigermtubi' MB_m1]EKD14431.1 pentatricopeptide repeat protein [Drepanopeziza brunnea f. sp. 'multigermtubi' MB_m1]KAJ5041185.1 hypothetical protein L3040_005736 [Drepanopeziza brunnea f. sp. 'multigermtubi']
MPPRADLLTKRWSTFDLPILPFLAPRVFQPWPRDTPRSHSIASRTKSHSRRCVRAYHDGLPQPLTNKQEDLGELRHWKPLRAVNSDSCRGDRANINEEVTGDHIEAGRNSWRDDRPHGASDDLGDEEDFWAKYEEIWGREATKRDAQDPMERVGGDPDPANIGKEPSDSRVKVPLGEDAFEMQESIRPCWRLRPFFVRSLKTTWRSFEPRSQRPQEAQTTRPSFKPRPQRLQEAQQQWLGEKRRSRRLRSQYLVRGLPTVRTKFVRLVPEGPYGNLSFSSSWNWRFAMLNARYDKAMAGARASSKVYTYKRPRIKQEFIDNLVRLESLALMTEEWKTLSPQTRNRVWQDVMLQTLDRHPHRAIDVLVATFIEPYPPGYAIADSLDYIFTHFLHTSKSQKIGISGILDLLLEKGPRGHIQLDQRTLCTSIKLMDAQRPPNTHSIKSLYDTLRKADHPLHVNTLIQFGTRFAKNGQFNTACEILQMLKDLGCDFNTPKVLSFCTLLLRQRRRTLPSGENRYLALDVFDFMMNSGAKPNIIIYNVLLENALENHEHETAWQLHSIMVESGLQPDAYTYSLLLKDSKLRMDPHAIKKVMEHVKHRAIRNSYIVNDVLHAILLLHQQEQKSDYAADGPKEQVASAFDRLLPVYCDYFNLEPLARIIPKFSERYPKLRIQRDPNASVKLEDPTAPTLVVMVTSFLDDIQNPLPALQLYDQFREMVYNNDPAVAFLTQTTHIWNLVLMSLGKFRETIGDCHTLIGDMISPPEQTPQSSLASEKRGEPLSDIDQAIPPQEDSFLERHDRQYAKFPHSDQVLRLPLASEESGHSKSEPSNPKALQDFSTELRDSQNDTSQFTVLTPPKPDVYTWSILIKIFMDHKQPRAAEKVLDMMRERDIEPSIVTWNTLAHGYASMQDTASLVGVLTRLRAAGLEADDATTIALSMIKNRRALNEELQKKNDKLVDLDRGFVEEVQEELKLEAEQDVVGASNEIGDKEPSEDELFATSWF